jgi:NitT/TauT family transport system ATP-binding protein
MQRRVSLARAFVTAPRLLLLDEPFVSLDAPTAGHLRALLLKLWQASGAAVVFVTHELREAAALGDRLVFLSRGPARVVHVEPVTLPRPRDPESPEVAGFCRRLLERHPGLLSGRVGPSPA